MNGITEKLEFWIGVGVAAVIVLGYLGKKSAAAASSIADAVNPVSTSNIFYSGVNGVGAAVSGDQSFSLGGFIYSATHPDPTALPQNPQDKSPAAPAGTVGNNVNPTADPYASPVDASVPGGGYPVF